jgi:diguanylate cyclase (GGDEF)-like protein
MKNKNTPTLKEKDKKLHILKTWRIGFLGLIFTSCILLLLGVVYLSQQRFQASIIQQMHVNIEKNAASLSYFYSERFNDLQNLSKNPALSHFFSSRALGMSMEYGLRPSLLKMQDIMGQFLQEKMIVGLPVYQRLEFYEINGERLIWKSSELDTGGNWQPNFNQINLHTKVILIEENGHVQTIITQPFMQKGVLKGVMTAWLNYNVIYTHLFNLNEQIGNTFLQAEGITLFLQNKKPLSKQSYQILKTLAIKLEQQAQDIQPHKGTLSVKKYASFKSLFLNLEQDSAIVFASTVSNTPFTLGIVYPQRDLFGFFTSYWFMIALITLAIIVLLTGIMVLRINMHNFLLHTRIKFALQQEKRLNQKNQLLEAEISTHKSYEAELTEQANFDALTHLPNRTLAMDRLHQALSLASRHQRKMMVMFIDLDHFKQVNDTLGHAAGDELLIQAASRLQSIVRESDTVARLGGDEFLMIVQEVSALEGAEVIGDKVMEYFNQPFKIEGHELYITTSVGIALYPTDGKDMDTLLQHADTALYRSKEEGRNAYRFYTPAMNEHARERNEMEEQLKHAIEYSELTLCYQPIMNIRQNKSIPVGVEALLRWDNKKLGSVSPERFIPLAEEMGLIQTIGDWVLQQACIDAAQFNQYTKLRIAINISARQIRKPEPFLKAIKAILKKTQLPAECLELEITENLLFDNLNSTDEALAALHQMGVRLSIDDFGTGYSSLSYLKRFPFDSIKIDKQFIKDILIKDDDAALTRAILAMAKVMKLEVIAEGVESQEQVAFLQAQGCQLAQGYYFSKPISAPILLARLQENADTLHKRI